MKNILLLLPFLIFNCCVAQSSIEPRYGGANYGYIQDAYYKDIDNFQDQFVGTWLYTNGNTSLKVIFLKKVKFYETIGTISTYEDYLIGGCQYIENGVEKVNTLASINIPMASIYGYYMYSKSRLRPDNYPKCTDCLPNEKRLAFEYDEPETKNDDGLNADFIIRRVVENGTEKLKVQFIKISASSGFDNDSQPTTVENFALPYGNYILTKQP